MTPLIQAISQGDAPRVASLLRAKQDHLVVDHQGWTALHWAVSLRHVDIVRMLLNHHIDNDMTANVPSTSRHALTFESASLLAARHLRSPISPIELAAKNNDPELFELLFQHLEAFEPDAFQFNPHWAPLSSDGAPLRLTRRSSREPESIRRYLTEEEPWNSRMRLAHLAICDLQLEVLQLFLEVGLDVKERFTFNEQTLLHTAAANQDPRFVQVLLDAGADPASYDKWGRTALQQALGNGCFRTGLVLIEACSPVNTPADISSFPSYYTNRVPADAPPLMQACGVYHRGLGVDDTDDRDLVPRVVRELIARGADVNASDKHGRTPFLAAVKEGNIDVLQLLLAANVDTTTVDSTGGTVYHYFALPGYGSQPNDERLTTVGRFLQRHLDPKHFDEPQDQPMSSLQGRHPLLVALGCLEWTAFRLLLEMGLSIRQTSHLAPYIDSAISHNQPEILEMLLACPQPDDSPSFTEYMGYAHPCPIGNFAMGQVLAGGPGEYKLIVPPWSIVNSAIHTFCILEDHGALKQEQPMKALATVSRVFDSEALAEALIQFGANPLAKEELDDVPWGFCSNQLRHEEEEPSLIFDTIGVAAINDNRAVLRCLLRHLRPSLPADHWLSSFELVRSDSPDDICAVLRCMKSAGFMKGRRWTAHMGNLVSSRGLPFIKRLVDCGMLDVDAPLIEGWRPLHIAVQQGRLDVIDYLLDKHVDVNTRTDSWYPVKPFNRPTFHQCMPGNPVTEEWKGRPLHLAVIMGLTDVVKSLLEAGADVNADAYESSGEWIDDATTNGCGRTPLDIALSTAEVFYPYDKDPIEPLGPRRLDIAEMLVEHGGKMTDDGTVAFAWEHVKKFQGYEELWNKLGLGRALC